MAFEWLFPPPLRNRGGLACKFPTMIYLPAHGSRKLQKVLDLRNVSFDADVPGVRLQILCERQIGSVLHRQGHTAFLRSYDVVSNSPQSDTHGANDQAGSLAAAVYRTDSNRLNEAGHSNRASIAGKGSGFHRKRPAAQNHSTGKIGICGDAFGDIGMKRAIPGKQVRRLYTHRVHTQFHRDRAFRDIAELSPQVRAQSFNRKLLGEQCSGSNVPPTADVHIQSGIVGTFGQIPAVDPPRARLHGIGPITRTVIGRRSALRRSVQSEKPTDAVILAVQKTEGIRKRSFAPVQSDLRRLQARRSAGEVTEHAEGSCRLQKNAASPGLGLKLEPPAAGRNLLDTSGNTRESERQFFLLILEIDSSFIEFDSLQVIHWRRWWGRWWC